MISNKLIKFAGLSKFIQAYPKYTFVSFPTKAQQKMLDANKHINYVKDDLMFPHRNAEWNGGIQQVCEHYKRNIDLDIAPVNAAMLMYNCAVANLYEPLVFEEIERHLHKYENQLRPRWAFGCLYGIYKTSAGTRKGIDFFEKEVLRQINDLSYQEIINLFEAISHNKQLSLEEKTEFIEQHLQPIILEKWKKLKSNSRMIWTVFQSLNRMQYQGKELWEPTLEILKKAKLNNYKMIEAYETMTSLQGSGKFYRDLSQEVEYWKNKSVAQDDRSYRYDPDGQRWFSFTELKERREEYKYTDQKQRSYVEELTAEERRLQKEREAQLAEERRQQERERALNEIVKERYIQLLRGDAQEEFQGMNQEDELLETTEAEQVEEEDIYHEQEIENLLKDQKGEHSEELKRKLKDQLIKAKKAREQASKVEEDE